MQKIQTELEVKDAALTAAEKHTADLDAQIKALQDEVAAAKAANAGKADTHNYDEAQTRDRFIDLLLRESGWALTDKRDTEFEVTGMPGGKKGKVDYVLWGDDGKPLALLEAKRTRRDPRPANSRPGSMPTAWSRRTAGGPSFTTPTAMSTTSGTTWPIRPGRCRASTPGTSCS